MQYFFFFFFLNDKNATFVQPFLFNILTLFWNGKSKWERTFDIVVEIVDYISSMEWYKNSDYSYIKNISINFK